jgi:hypothetical protein
MDAEYEQIQRIGEHLAHNPINTPPLTAPYGVCPGCGRCNVCGRERYPIYTYPPQWQYFGGTGATTQRGNPADMTRNPS